VQTRELSPVSIATLNAADLDRIRFSDWARTTNEAIKQTLAAYPGRSVWIPETHEFAIVAPWRHRDEIAHVAELSAVRHPVQVIEEAARRAGEHGANLVVSLEMDEIRPPAFYANAGFSLLERVVTYEYYPRGDEADSPPWLDVRIMDPVQQADLDLLGRLDHDIFPWLWWNSEAEFRSYAESPGTEAFVCSVNGEPVSYVSITAFLGWGHLDRIGVLPGRQGKGIGRAALQFAVNRLLRLGARRIALSTQMTNEQSRRLYERYGFRRANAHDYRVYGRLLQPPVGVERIT
jgi:ribosomal protein S18 acetylase RimI-like enzyme